MSQTRFKLTYTTSPQAGRLAVLTMDNGEDHRRPNVFDEAALRSLHEAMDELGTQDDVAGLLLTGKPFVFAAGADLTEFAGMDADRARAAARAGHEAFGRLADLPYPTLAAINGVCIGGGLEIALHCDYRTVSTGARLLGFSEVFLSILPAWGGTQLATPLVGAADAVQTIVVNALNNNRLMKPAEAVERGYGDRLLDGATFLDDSLALLEQFVTGEVTIERDVAPDAGLDEALGAGRAAADGRTHGATRAPYLALELIEFAARGGDLDEGRRREQDALSQLLPSRQAQASVYAFDLTQQRAKRQPGRPDAEPRPIRQVAVVGAGLMGAQLGSLFLQRLEVPVVMKDIDEAVLERARTQLDGDLDRRVQKGRLSEGKARFLKGLVTYTTSYDEVAGSDWVIEAVLERRDLKQTVLADLEEVVDDTAVLATNTSSLSVADMASKLAHPERVVGFHFFNPVAVMPLVEVIRPDGAADQPVATAFAVAAQLGKTAVLCADRPAFVVNRLMLRFNAAATEALRYGNEFREIDTAIKQMGAPMGPFELFGLVGLKVALHTAETLAEAFPDRYTVDDNLRALAELDLPGVYDWSQGGEVFPQARAAVTVDVDASPLTAEEIRQRAVDAVADECRRMLDDGTVADPRDIDTAMLLGAGWAFFTGGACRYADDTGVSDRLFGRRLLAEVADGA